MSDWLESHLFINHALGGIFYFSVYLLFALFIFYLDWYISDIGIIKNKNVEHLFKVLISIIIFVIFVIVIK